MSHTKEPWAVHGVGVVWSPSAKAVVAGASELYPATVTYAEPDYTSDHLNEIGANADRIVACVNACEGIATDAFSEFPDGKISGLLDLSQKGLQTVRALRAELAALKAERDAAVDALRDMYAGWLYIRSSHGDLYGVGWDRAQKKAESVLELSK